LTSMKTEPMDKNKGSFLCTYFELYSWIWNHQEDPYVWLLFDPGRV
jgi:hypothetical protein